MEAFAIELGQARQGSSEALSGLLGRYRTLLLWTAIQSMNSDLLTKAGASDVVQETMLEAVRDFPNFCGSSDEQWQAWLRQILANNVANFDRRYRRTSKRALNRELSIDDKSAVRRDAESMVQREPMPDVQVIEKESAEAVRSAMVRLPDDYREILNLRYQNQLGFAEIAVRMSRSENAVRKLWARALHAMQSHMDGKA